MARLAMAAIVIGLLATQAPSAGAARAGAPQWAEQAQERVGGAYSQFLETLRAWAFMLRFAGENAQTVAELARAAPGNMSILINALPRADLNPIIAEPDLKVTIFAPTNQAFQAALLKLKLTPIQLYADKTALTNILSYHVVADQALKVGDLKDKQELTTVAQHKLTVVVDKATGTSIKGATEEAKIIAPDLTAGQSVIHVVDTVLLPPVKPSK